MSTNPRDWLLCPTGALYRVDRIIGVEPQGVFAGPHKHIVWLVLSPDHGEIGRVMYGGYDTDCDAKAAARDVVKDIGGTW